MGVIKFGSETITAVAVLAALIILASASPGNAGHILTGASGLGGQGAQLVIPMMNPALGKKIFVDKGCVACHAVNGVGGHDAPAMDAHREMGLVNPFDFAARMWNHAPGMIAAQEGAFGEQIYFTGSELADMIAFLHDEGVQHEFGEKDLTKKARAVMQHGHGEKAAPEAHADEVGHGQDAAKKSDEDTPATAAHDD